MTTMNETDIDGSTHFVVGLLSDPTTAARILSAVAERTGNATFRSAAGMVAARCAGGRPPKSDALPLEHMAAMLQDGVAGTIAQASRFVARSLRGEISTDAAARRLARKYRAAIETPAVD